MCIVYIGGLMGGKCVMWPTTPSMAMYKTLLGRTMLKRRSMYSKMATIISSSFFGAGLQRAQQLVYNLQLQDNSEENCMVTSGAERSKGIIKALFIFLIPSFLPRVKIISVWAGGCKQRAHKAQGQATAVQFWPWMEPVIIIWWSLVKVSYPIIHSWPHNFGSAQGLPEKNAASYIALYCHHRVTIQLLNNVVVVSKRESWVNISISKTFYSMNSTMHR